MIVLTDILADGRERWAIYRTSDRMKMEHAPSLADAEHRVGELIDLKKL